MWQLLWNNNGNHNKKHKILQDLKSWWGKISEDQEEEQHFHKYHSVQEEWDSLVPEGTNMSNWLSPCPLFLLFLSTVAVYSLLYAIIWSIQGQASLRLETRDYTVQQIFICSQILVIATCP